MKINFSLNKETAGFKQTIKSLYLQALSQTGMPNNVSVNVALVSAEEIKNLNKTYRGIDKVTDVLSFPMIDDFSLLEQEPDFKFGDVNIGDVYINLERAKEQAQEYGHGIKREFCFLALHGFLHLLGFDHMNEQDEKQMFGLANKIMEAVDLKRV